METKPESNSSQRPCPICKLKAAAAIAIPDTTAQAASKYTSPDIAAPPLFEASTEQRVGLGFGYSTVARYARSVSVIPLEVFYTHLETIMATGGLTPKYRRDQIEFRIYYRLRRAGR